MDALGMIDGGIFLGVQLGQRFKKSNSIFTLVGFFFDTRFWGNVDFNLIGGYLATGDVCTEAEHGIQLSHQQID